MEALFKVFKLDNKSLNSRIVNGGVSFKRNFPHTLLRISVHSIILI